MSGILNDTNKTDNFDRSEVVLGDGTNPNQKATVDKFGSVSVKHSKENSQVDTSGRLRTTLPIELLSYYFANTDHNLKFSTTQAGGSTGTVTLTLNKGSVTVSNSTGNGHKLNFSTKKYVRYTPGQTHKSTIALRVGVGKTNVEKRWGMFTEFNGFFFKQTSTGLSVVIREGGAGDPVSEVTVDQANWNIDKLDGTGPSGLNLNPDNHGIYIIEWDWHGAGSVKFGVKYDREIVYCHQALYDFQQTDTSIRSPGLPVNIEIKNVGAVTGNTDVLISALSVYKDGESRVTPNYGFSTSNGTTGRLVTNGGLLPVLSIRPKLSFKGILARVGLQATHLEVLSSSNNIYVQVILNGTLTGAAFASVNPESNAERDISATVITGGTIIWEGYIATGAITAATDSDNGQGPLEIWQLDVNYAGTVADTLTVACRSLGNNSDTFVGLRWVEFQ